MCITKKLSGFNGDGGFSDSGNAYWEFIHTWPCMEYIEKLGPKIIHICFIYFYFIFQSWNFETSEQDTKKNCFYIE